MQLQPIFKTKIPFTKRLFTKTYWDGQYGIYVYDIRNIIYKKKFQIIPSILGFVIQVWGFEIIIEQYCIDIELDPCVTCYYDPADCFKDISRNYKPIKRKVKPCYYDHI